MLAAAVAVAASLLALAAPLPVAEAAPVPQPARYEGGALLRGMLFGLGPVAEAYPELVYARLPQTPPDLARLEGLLTVAQQRDPGLFDRFAAAMYSRDRAVIGEVALEAMAALDYRVTTGNNSGQAYLGDDLALAAGRPQRHDPQFMRWVSLVAQTL